MHIWVVLDAAGATVTAIHEHCSCIMLVPVLQTARRSVEFNCCIIRGPLNGVYAVIYMRRNAALTCLPNMLHCSQGTAHIASLSRMLFLSPLRVSPFVSNVGGRSLMCGSCVASVTRWQRTRAHHTIREKLSHIDG